MISPNNYVMLFVATSLFGLVGRPGQAAPVRDERSSLEAAYSAMDAAAAHRDVEKVLSYDSPDYKATSINGQVYDLAKQRRVTQMTLGTAERASSTTEIKQVKLSGQIAVVVAKRHYDFTMAILDPDTGKHDRFVCDMLVRDTWYCEGQRWLRRSTQMLSYKEARNGRTNQH